MQPTRFSQPRPPRFLVLRNSDSVDEGFGWRSKSGRTVPLGVMANRWQLTPPPYLEHEKARFVQPNERLELQNNAGRRKTHTPCASPRRTSRAAKRAGTPKDHPKRAGIPKDHPKGPQGSPGPRGPNDPPRREPQGTPNGQTSGNIQGTPQGTPRKLPGSPRSFQGVQKGNHKTFSLCNRTSGDPQGPSQGTPRKPQKQVACAGKRAGTPEDQSNGPKRILQDPTGSTKELQGTPRVSNLK